MGATPPEPAAAGAIAAGGGGVAPPARSQLRLSLLGLSSVLVLLAVVAIACGLAAARVPQHRAALEDLIRHETGLEVRFSELSVRWGWYGPEAVFHSVELGEPGRGVLLRAPRLIVGLDTWRLARSGHLEAARLTLQNPDIDLAAGAAVDAAVRASGHARDRRGLLREGAHILSRWRGGQISIEGGTLRAALPDGSAALTLSLRRVQLRRLGADWSADALLLLPENLGGDVHLAVQLRGDPARPESSSGTLSLEGRRLEFGGWRLLARDPASARYLPQAGSGNLALHAAFAHGQVLSADGRIGAQALAWHASSAAGGTLALQHLRGDWQLARRGGEWHLSIGALDIAPAPNSLPAATAGPTASQGSATLSVDVAADGSWARGRVQHAPLPVVAALARWQFAQSPGGTVLGGQARELTFDWSAQRPAGARLAAAADLQDLTVATPSGELALGGLSGHVAGTDGALVADLEAHAAVVTRGGGEQPWTLDGLEVAGRLIADSAGGGWRLGTDRLEIRRGGLTLIVSGAIGTGASGARLVNARLSLRDGDVALLAGLLGAQALAAPGAGAAHFTAGRIESADFSWRGPLSDEPPWSAPAAQFSGSIALRDARLGGGEEWPESVGIDARIDWRGARVHAAIDHAQCGTFQLTGASADWDARGLQPTHFTGRLAGNAQEALAWVRTHLQAAWAPGAVDIDLRGDALLDFDITAPAARAAGTAARPPRVRVTAQLDGGELRPLAGLPPISALRGALAFEDGHLQHSTLTGEWLGGSVSLGVGEHRERGTTVLTIFGRGLIGARQAVQAAGARAEDVPLAGNTEWSALLTVGPGADGQPAHWQLTADTSLVGVTSRLPEPLAKPAGATLPLHLELQSGSDTGQLHVSLGERINAIAALTRSGDTWRIERGAVRLAATAPALPAEAVMLLDGRVSRLDLAAYLALWRHAGSDAALPVFRARLTAGQLLAGTRSYPEVSVTAQAARGGGTLQLQSERLTGTVRWPGAIDSAHPAVVQLAGFDIAQPQDIAFGTALAVVLGPATQLSVDDLTWQGRSLGRFAAVLAAHDAVLDASELHLSGAGGEALASAHCEGSSCKLKFSLDSSDAASTLAAFGLRPDLSASRAHFEGELRWSARVSAPLATLSGHLHMQLDQGMTQAAVDSSGVPFALLSVPALLAGMSPEADVSPHGLRFARLTADYELREGDAATSDLHFDGDAEILVRGRVGLAAGDYDEQAWILRGEDRLPAAVRRLGPTPRVAAMWLSLREMFGGEPSDRTRATLHLRGTWDDPIVTPGE